MSEAKDPAIKLFGRTIPLQETQIPVDPGEKSDPPTQIPVMSEEDKDVCRVTVESEASGSPEKEPYKAGNPVMHNNGNGNSHQTNMKENGTMLNPKPEEGQMETDSDGQEKVLKKPDKILPCPRCNSLDTKFCYYNNYNVNQPRHFCKNCQRYWTAGGTMRNVPVGAGRRKNKHIASQYRQLMMSSEGMPTTQVDAPESVSHQGLSSGGVAATSVPINGNGTALRVSAPSVPINGNGAVLRFGPDVPLCESMASGLNLGDQNKKVELPTMICGENGEEPSPCSSSMTSSTVSEKELPGRIVQMEHGGMPGCFSVINPPHPLQCYPGPPWPYPWNSGWNNVAAVATGRCSSELVPGSDNGSPKPVQWGSAPMMAAPGLCAPTMPFPFVPASYWGCMPNWAARAWNMPWIGPNGSISPSSSTSNSGCSSNGSPTLGKHSRDANLQGEEKPEKCLWVPKTLRIDDPDDAAKSSIWATLGIKPDKNEPITKGGIFKAFHQKTDGNCASDAEQVLQANPAALSRSQSFQENT